MHKCLAYLNGRAPGDVYKALGELEILGVNIPSLMLKRYKISRRWSDRALCVSQCIEYATTDEDAYRLGIIALKDKSRAVRRRACKLLSVAQKREAIGHLEGLLSNEASRADAEATIDALKKHGHD